MKRKSVEIVSLLFVVAAMLSSCSLEFLNVRGVAYQSFRSNAGLTLALSGLRASPLNAELCPGGQPGPEPGLNTTVPRPHAATEDHGLSLRALRLGPSAPEPPCPPSQAGPLAAPGTAQLCTQGCPGAEAARCPRLAGGSEESTTGTSSAAPGAGTRPRASGGSAGGLAPTSRRSAART